MTLSRRDLLVVGVAAAGLVGRPALSSQSCPSALTPTESIDPPPEYLPGTPMRTSLLEDGPGQRIKIFGRALTTTCEPLHGARLDFWQTNEQGLYDTTGHRFRGAQQTDSDGRFQLETVMPGPYNGPRHIHFLLATRIDNQPQPLMLSGGIFFPTPEEFAKQPVARRRPEFFDPSSLRTADGVLMVPCDIVLEVT